MSELDINWTFPRISSTGPLQELEESARLGAYLLVNTNIYYFCKSSDLNPKITFSMIRFQTCKKVWYTRLDFTDSVFFHMCGIY